MKKPNWKQWIVVIFFTLLLLAEIRVWKFDGFSEGSTYDRIYKVVLNDQQIHYYRPKPFICVGLTLGAGIFLYRILEDEE